MFIKKTEENTTVQDLIDGVTSQMQTYDAFSEEYAKMNEQLHTLHKMRMTEKGLYRPSADVVLNVIGSLAGIATIVSFEHAHVITSKALGFVKTLK